MKNIIKILTVIAFIAFAISSCKKCEYEQCSDSCTPIEDFSDTANLWQGDFITIAVDTVKGHLTASSIDKTQIYNTDDYPSNLVDAGCELKYDVGVKRQNFATIDTSLIIFNGTSPAVNTQMAVFVLNASSVIYPNLSVLTNVAVPLETASGTSLPSNVYGTWVINSGPPYSASDITDFNTLIQNISGIGFITNRMSSGAEEVWSFDNFCISDCCNGDIDIE